MANHLLLFVTSSLMLHQFQEVLTSSGTYSAVVVEYSPVQDSTVDAETNILNNVRNYVSIVNTAKDQFQADIVVFPEEGLKGYGNQEHLVEVPDPSERVRPCASNMTYDAALLQLSCAARATQTYIVVNLGEKFYNSSQQKNLYFNTDVVFDSNGTIIARYRKIHLFSENGKSPSPNKELVFFDTAFGVRFGIFTCFDIIFEDPGVILARQFNIAHFIFPTAWFSQMPFLTAIQEQYYWSYTQDVVLLAAGYSDPSVGSSGSGIYLGRRGPATYNMTQTAETFMLHANVPKELHSKDFAFEEMKNSKSATVIISQNEKPFENTPSDEKSSDKIILKQEGFLKMYTTKLLSPPASSMRDFNGSEFKIPFTIEERICQNDLCCNFSLDMTATFNKASERITRGDDYSQLYYRLAVFDGVRDYDKIAHGGLQTCAIISCVNSEINSCGLRSDNSSAQPNMFYNFFQTSFVFNSITISGNFLNNHSAVGPNVLLTGVDNNFGSLLPPENFDFYKSQMEVNGTVMRTFQTLKAIPKLVTASLYGRLYSRDDQSEKSLGSSPSSCYFCLFVVLLICVSSTMVSIDFHV